jgi:hypothetical protein
MGFAAPIRASLGVLLLAMLMFGAATSECTACNYCVDCCDKAQLTSTTPAQQPIQASPVLPDFLSVPALQTVAPVSETVGILQPHIQVFSSALRI